MKNRLFSQLLPHLLAIIIFLIVAVIYCRPVLQGQVLQQHDVTQWRAMAQNSFEFKEKHGHFPLWTNSMFSGMPAYQIAMESRNPVSPGLLYYVLTLGLPKPISFFFLACICFYFLTQVLRISPWAGIIGGLAFAYATYNVIIIGAGHDTKMQSIALMPAFIGALILLYEGRYLAGGALTALATTLMVGMNHFQIVYYALLMAFFMTIAYVIRWIMRGEWKHMAIAASIAIAAGITGVLSNALLIFTTYEYASSSIRGGSALADNKNLSPTGLDKDYALSYSFYKTEPFVLMVPDIYGGATIPVEQRLEDSKALEALQSMPPELANQIAPARTAYWGGIVESAGTSGPPYAGAIICFLALLGFFVLDNRHKWWALGAMVLAFFMSWGHYFEGFNTLLLRNLPMYNKFRAPSMALVIPSFLLCMLAVLTLDRILRYPDREELWQKYKKGLILTAAVFFVLLLIYMNADFRGGYDQMLIDQTTSLPDQARNYIRGFIDALRDDRRDLFFGSLMRSFLFIAAAGFVIWLTVKKQVPKGIVLGIVGLLSFIDLMAVDVKYLNSERYEDEMVYESGFSPSPADQQIMQDTSYYRVFDLRQGLGTLTYGARTAYFHHSIGGYHPAKLSIYQDLIEHQLMRFPQSMPVVNMLNTKYVIQADQSGREQVIPNPEALGHAWFVRGIRYESSPSAVMNALTGFSPSDTAILFESDRRATATIRPSAEGSQIRLVSNLNDHIVYESSSPGGGFAVFSEIFYQPGWKAYIDDREVPIYRTNYVLRGLAVPEGNHMIRFEFRPASYYTGDTVSIIAGLLVILGLIAASVQFYRKRKAES